MRRSLCIIAYACAATAHPLPACAQSQEPAAQASAANPGLLHYYLAAFINGRDTGWIVQVDSVDNRLRIAADELTAIGIATDTLPLDADRQIFLDDIPGLRYHYDAVAQSMAFELPEQALVAERLGEPAPPPQAATSATGLVINYAMQWQSTRIQFDRYLATRRLRAPVMGSARYGTLPLMAEAEVQREYDRSNRSFNLSTELRLFSRLGTLVNSGYTTVQGGQSDYVRQDSYWTYTDVDRLRTYTVGDLVTSSLPWSRAIRLGGVSLVHNFEARPDLVTFPFPLLGGNAVVPTNVELYVNGLRQFTGQASGGPFVIAAPPALTGAGQATLMYQDASGRLLSQGSPLYVDARLLAPGYSEYALEAGYPRLGYGSRSFDYQSGLAASAMASTIT